MATEEIRFVMQIASDNGISITEARATDIWITVKDEICHGIIHLAELIKDQLVTN